MNWLKRLSNRFKKYEKWIEIKIPHNIENKEDNFFKDDNELLDEEEEKIHPGLDIRKEEE